jgi:hypothetical protein
MLGRRPYRVDNATHEMCDSAVSDPFISKQLDAAGFSYVWSMPLGVGSPVPKGPRPDPQVNCQGSQL